MIFSSISKFYNKPAKRMSKGASMKESGIIVYLIEVLVKGELVSYDTPL